MDIRKWCTIIKLEGYTTPSSARTLVEKLHQIVESLEDEGVETDVFMLLEDTKGSQSVAKPTLPSVTDGWTNSTNRASRNRGGHKLRS